MKNLLLEGGVAGHLMHLYDNPEMTFNKIAKILYKASSGELEGTEKADGYNIYLGAVGGEARAARNKGDMAKGGMTMRELAAREFAGGEQVRSVYVNSFKAFQSAIDSLTPDEQSRIFGLDGEIFYNAEIMGPGASNLLNYDANIIAIHHGGHKRYDAESNKLVVVDTEENSRVLDKVIDRFEQATADEDFSVQRTAVMGLEALDNDSHVKVALEQMKAVGFDGGMTIGDFLRSYVAPVVERTFTHLADQTKVGIVDRILNVPGANLTQLTKGFPIDQKKAISSFIKENQKQLLADAIWPIEKAIHDFAVKMLEGLRSAYILDNESEVVRLKAEVEQAIKSIHSYSGPGEDEAMTVLYKQLQKLEHHNNISTPIEGFVFEYEGQMYKFTGNFAPINQILGLFKYGRGNVPPIQKDAPGKRNIYEEENEDEIESGPEAHGPLSDPLRTVAVIPGAFKPPHRGHMEMVSHYAELADEVIIMVSKLPRKTPGGREITAEDSIGIWNIYIDALGHNNVKAISSEHASPVRAAYEFVEKHADPGSKVILGTSTKGGDQSRFARNVQSYAKPGVEVLNPMMYAFDPVGEVLSATDFRVAIDDKADISPWLPENIPSSVIFGILNIKVDNDFSTRPPAPPLSTAGRPPEGTGLGSRMVEEVLPIPIFFQIIEEELNEHEGRFQKSVYKKHAPMKNRLIGLGDNDETGGGEGHKRPDMQRTKSAPPLGENEELDEISPAPSPVYFSHERPKNNNKKKKKKEKEDLEEMSSVSAGGSVEGGGTKSPFPGIENEEDRDDLTIRRSEPGKRDSLIREDDIVERIVDYLLKTGVQEISQ